MIVGAILEVFYICASQNPYDGCHSEIAAEFNLDIHQISDDVHHTFLEEHGWLLVGEMAYCPVCRFELHD